MTKLVAPGPASRGRRRSAGVAAVGRGHEAGACSWRVRISLIFERAGLEEVEILLAGNAEDALDALLLERRTRRSEPLAMSAVRFCSCDPVDRVCEVGGHIANKFLRKHAFWAACKKNGRTLMILWNGAIECVLLLFARLR